ncbi:MAG TPA: hypothetical protein PKY95_05635 [candidate division Zixibacteria bacterium]|nr:hypothetical protein [candidate division Zixibacteria bacterium]
MESDDFELLAPAPLNVLCFRYRPTGAADSEALNRLNERLLEEVNRTGRVFITHTKLNGAFTLRMVIGQTQVTADDVDLAWETIAGTARALGRG